MLRHGRHRRLARRSSRAGLACRRLVLVVTHHLHIIGVLLSDRVAGLGHQEATRVDVRLRRLFFAGLSHLIHLSALIYLSVLQGAELLRLL